jgi:hypothetical protein
MTLYDYTTKDGFDRDVQDGQDKHWGLLGSDVLASPEALLFQARITEVNE